MSDNQAPSSVPAFDVISAIQMVGVFGRGFVVAYAGDAMIHAGYWTTENAEANAGKLLVAVGVLLYSCYQKWHNRQKLIGARLAPAMSLDEATKK